MNKVVGLAVGLVGALLLVAAVVAGAPLVGSVVFAHVYSALWSWTALEVLVSGVVGVGLAQWGYAHE